MKKFFYPAIFETEEKGYSVYFPDLKGYNSCGDTMEEAYKMAKEALGLMISYLRDEKKEVPAPSDPVNLKPADNQAVVIVELDFMVNPGSNRSGSEFLSGIARSITARLNK